MQGIFCCFESWDFLSNKKPNAKDADEIPHSFVFVSPVPKPSGLLANEQKNKRTKSEKTIDDTKTPHDEKRLRDWKHL